MKTNKFILAALAALMLAACSKDNENQPRSSFPEDGIVRVTTGVDDIVTRAGLDNSNITAREIGFIFVPEGRNNKYTYENVKLNYNGSRWVSEKTMYWQDKTTMVDVIAYTPWQDGVTWGNELPLYWETPADQSTTGKLEAADVVWQRRNVYPDQTGDEGLTSDGKINLRLKHVLSKIELKLTIGTDITDETPDAAITSVLIRGLKKNAVVFFADASVRRLTEQVDITPCPVGNGVYEAIFLPQEVTAGQFSVEITLSNTKTYTYTLSDVYTFAGGTLYKLPIQVGTSTPRVAFLKTGITATNWGTENSLGDKITD